MIRFGFGRVRRPSGALTQVPRENKPDDDRNRQRRCHLSRLLADRGIDYLFGNAGTDFAPLIEAYAQAAQRGTPVPRPILAAHENLAVAMAHGYAMVTRKIPAVMVHVSVGTANMACAAMNAAGENIAILLTAGRAPITETGMPGARDGYIHWAQAATIAARRAALEDQRTRLLHGWSLALEAAKSRLPVHPAWVSHCLGAAKDAQAIVVNEYTLRLEHCNFEHADSFFASSSASGLGWGAGAALGAKLGAPHRPVISVLGDGAYLFSNPAAIHHAAALHELPVLFVIMNNAMWHAVHHFTAAMYPKGWAAKSNAPPFTRLDKLPAFEQICASAGGYGRAG